MDIVSRIKKFIEVSTITNSQFADTCLIPRPTVSQLLNGRNKKVSDEIIGKIHAAYPNLSISWLLFDEGEMFIDSSLNNSENDSGDENSIFPDDTMDLFENENLSELSVLAKNGIVSDSDKANDSNVSGESASSMLSNLSSKPIKPNSDRKVVNIIVFYSDNSFEYFKPVQK